MIVTRLKSDQLFNDLWDELTKLNPGEKFPSQREIMKRYGVSQLTVEKAVAKLRDDGYLLQTPNKSLIASEHIKRFNSQLSPTLMLAVPRWASSDAAELEQTVEELRSSYPDYRLLVYKFDIGQTIPSQLPMLEENVAGLLILPTSGTITLADVTILQSFNVPLILWGWHLDSFGIASVGTDDIFAGAMCMHYLFERGHRKIGILLSEPHNKIIMDRVKGAMDYAELNHIEVQIVDCEVVSGEVAAHKTYQKFRQVIESGISFTAMVAISGESLQGAVNACYHCHISIPDKLSIIAIGNEKLTETFFPPVTVAAIRCNEQIKVALDILSSSQREERKTCYVKPTIIERQSVKAIQP